ncbi:MAG: glycogen synthase GlgA [Bacteroidetes bacterium]|nr:glycogen synthase GlgA [Bacteroidota bacterium]MCW5894195.1 glycogen synthase GlgA [Bacteroidota bacterium]
MAKPIQVLFISSEVEPFAKTGGLADVSGALPHTIYNLGLEVRIMLPRYGSIKNSPSKLHDMIRLQGIDIPVGDKVLQANVKSSFILGTFTKVQVYLLDNPDLFGRPGLYVHPDSKKAFPDNDIRFIFFCRGVLEMLKKMGWQPDIIHCNDWHTALIPAYLKTLYKDDKFYKNTKSVLTIHNLAYQGDFPKTSFAKTLLPPELEEDVLHNGRTNFLKAGLLHADVITAVSTKYAEEIRTTEEYGCGLQSVLQKRKRHLVGITNGMDVEKWNPETDELIPQQYSIKKIELKVENKKALLARMKMPFKESTPVIGIISRLADQKGFDLIGEIIDKLAKLNAQVVLLGVGEKKYHTLFERAAKKYPEKFGICLRFDQELAHWIEAGSDMFLMPSRYEPCGLNQLYSMKYGTIPIVRATGGLDETVEQVDPAKGTGTGFKFTEYDSKALLSVIQLAVQQFANQTLWRKIQKNAMTKDFSWEASAKKYINLYKKLLH